jgi:acetyltransferase
VNALQVLLDEPQADAILFIHAPTAIVPSADIASALAPLIKTAGRNVLACWLGGDAIAQARNTFADAGIPTYATPETAVRAFMQIVQYRRNQQMLMQVPHSLAGPINAAPENRAAAHAAVDKTLAEKREMMSEPEAKIVLAAYGIPVVSVRWRRRCRPRKTSAFRSR